MFKTLYYWYWQFGSKYERWKNQSNTSERRDRSAGIVVGAVVGGGGGGHNQSATGDSGD